jgi:hypothetical protein
MNAIHLLSFGDTADHRLPTLGNDDTVHDQGSG